MKILVCGAAGCIASNFMRYMIYRSKEFNFASFDKLIYPADYKKIYHHNKHKFYIGDACDKDFLERLIIIEKPDIIVSGLFYHKNSPGSEYTQMVKAITNLAFVSYEIPVIQIGPPVGTKYDDGIYTTMKNMLINSKLPQNTYIEIPNVFGPRQRPHCHLYTLLNDSLFNGCMYAQDQNQPWVFIEDLASFIWYIIETKKSGHIRMPVLGWTSEFQIANYINKLYNNRFEVYKNQDDKQRIIEHGKPSKTDWVADSVNLMESLEKTIRWYDANRWVFNMYRC